MRDEHIQEAFLVALNEVIARYHNDTKLPHAIATMFDTTRLESKAMELERAILELADQLEALISENQQTVQDQDIYQARYTHLDAKYQEAVGQRLTAARKALSNASRKTTR